MKREERKEQKRREAVARCEEFAKLSPSEKLAKLDARLGVNQGAKKQRAKLQAQIK